jgi:hypothetical protein
MGYSSAAVTTRSLPFASLGPGVFRNLILRAVRGALKRLGAVESLWSADVAEVEGKRKGRVGATRIGE